MNSGPKEDGAPGGKLQSDMHLILQLMRRIGWLAMNKGGVDEVSHTHTYTCTCTYIEGRLINEHIEVRMDETVEAVEPALS
jgi:hypothetical protein